MGPRPLRQGVRSEAAARTKPVVVERLPSRVVVKPVSRHVALLDTVPLPAPVVTALASIAEDLRHLPRDAIVDKAELLVWLRRMAGRVDGVAALRVTISPPRPKRPPPGAPGRDLAETVFGPSASRGATATRTVTSRRGQRVAVELRRARERGQAELPC